MDNILYDFNENVINLMKSFLFNLEGNKDLSSFTDNLTDQFAQFGKNLIQNMIDYAEEIIFKLNGRNKMFESLEKDDRTITTIFGSISFCRRYYKDLETGNRIYLLDQYFELKPNERLLQNVQARIIDEATISSYQHAGEVAAYGEVISKEKVKNTIEDLNLDNKVIRTSKNSEKKKIKKLYIIADEDHVHLQKGGITEPRMVIIYEGIAKFGKRVVLQNKTHIGGNYDGKVEELWTEVLTYIENNYDTEYLERIYLQGDGGAWIVSGKEYLIKAKYVLDEFHMKKAVNSIVGRITKINKEENLATRKKLRDMLRKLDFESFKETCYEMIAEEMDSTARARKERNMEYILNNIEGITNLYENQEDLHGCSAEGHISHIYSDRMSSRPMGWKSENVDKMSRLRLLREDGIRGKEILEKQGKIVEFEEIKKIRHQAKEKMEKTINVRVGTVPALKYGSDEEKNLLSNLLKLRVI